MIVVIVVLLGAVGMLAVRRRPRQDEGLRSFRRHIDALSPEARREVQDRARRSADDASAEIERSGNGADLDRGAAETDDRNDADGGLG